MFAFEEDDVLVLVVVVLESISCNVEWTEDDSEVEALVMGVGFIVIVGAGTILTLGEATGFPTEFV